MAIRVNTAYLVDRVSNGYVQTNRDYELTDNLLELDKY
jgi:hypothetical protein